METGFLFFLLLLLYLVVWEQKRRERIRMQQRIHLRNREERINMHTFAKQLIGKECIVYTLQSSVEGLIKDVSDGGLLLEHSSDHSAEMINLDFVVRIREYPKKKNGKKKSVVLD